jgi:hypothetical protein
MERFVCHNNNLCKLDLTKCTSLIDNIQIEPNNTAWPGQHFKGFLVCSENPFCLEYDYPITVETIKQYNEDFLFRERFNYVLK